MASYIDGYQQGRQDSVREAKLLASFNWPARWEAFTDELLDQLTRHFDREDPHVAQALRKVRKDYNHPSNVWKPPPRFAPDETLPKGCYL